MLGSRILFSGPTLQERLMLNVEGRLSKTKGTRDASGLWEPGMQNRKFCFPLKEVQTSVLNLK